MYGERDFIPVTVQTDLRISAETGDVAGTNLPWWGAIALIDLDPPT